MLDSSTVVFWGAGATARLGMRTTLWQGRFIASLTGADHGRGGDSLDRRIRSALGDASGPHWRGAFHDLLTILGDADTISADAAAIPSTPLDVMARHWRAGAAEGELRRRVDELRQIYDWPALREIVRVCPGVGSGAFKINDLFNLMDMHAPFGHGFRAEDGRFLDARRILGAKAALKMLLGAMFYADYQDCLDSGRPALDLYYDFATVLGQRMQRDAAGFADGFDRRDFILGSVGFVSLNYDPIALWTQFVANRDLNRSPSAPHLGRPASPVQIFHDMGHFIPSRRIEPRRRPALWYPMNEASAQRLNESGSGANQRVRLGKFLFPHGCLCWRECPDCGKLSSYHGDEWSLASRGLIPPPPLRGFERTTIYPVTGQLNAADAEARFEEKVEWERGYVDARACLHCGTLTFAHHTQTVMQSSFKQAPPSFIEEIQRDLRALVMRADHIVFMGYSLPLDDVSYRSFFAARLQRKDGSRNPVRCTIVDYNSDQPGWIGPADPRLKAFQEGSVVRNAMDIFGEDNIRFFGGGIPTVFLDGHGTVSPQKVDELLTWPSA